MALPYAEGLLFIWVCWCGFLDYRYRKLPNLLTLSAYLPAILVMIISSHGWLGDTISSSLIAWLAAVILTLPAYSIGWLAAGDVKYLSAIGLLCGLETTLICYVVAALLSFISIMAAPFYKYLLLFISSKTRHYSSITLSNQSIPFGSFLSLGVIVGLIAR